MTAVQYEIRDNIPLPSKASGGKSGVSKYPFGALDIGQSFVVGAESKVAIRSALTAFRKNHKDMSFATRVLEDGGVGIWRTA